MLLQLGTFIWVTAGIVIAFLMPDAYQLRATPAAFFHVPMAIAMEIAFLLAAIYGGLWLWKREAKFDARSIAYAEVGAVYGVIALTTGAVWAKLNWNAYWSWDPQQIGIVATLLTYAALFSLRGATEDEDRQRNGWAVYAIMGVIAAVFWTFLFRRMMPSLHPTNTLTKSDPLFKLALYFNVVGYAMVMMWIVELRARAIARQEHLQNRALEAQWSSL